MQLASKFQLIALSALCLTACSSEVDKCLEVEMAAWSARQERIKAAEMETQLRCDEDEARRAEAAARELANPQQPSTGSDYFKGIVLPENCLERARWFAAGGIGEYLEESDKRSREEVVAEKRLLCMRSSK